MGSQIPVFVLLSDASLEGVVAAGRDGARVQSSRSRGSGDFLSMLTFTTREVQGVLVVAFEATDDGAHDWQSTQRDWLYKLIESHPDSRFVIDLSEVNYLASSEIGFLVTLKRRIDRRQGRVVMFGAGDYIMDLFRTMNLVKIFDMTETLPLAMAKLGSA